MLHVGDCLDIMPTLSSVDSIVTDPPYHLTTGKKGGSGVASLNPNSPAGRSVIGTGFMGKAWDGGDIAHDPALWREALRVAKPGAHLLAFGGTRTHHRLACAIEDAGWEIRDCLGWLYGSGFPKSLNVGNGFGTALKPAWEPIILARKPLSGTVARNVQEHGTGALNIDGCRVQMDGSDGGVWGTSNATVDHDGRMFNGSNDGDYRSQRHPEGRFPANIIHDGSDEVLSVFPQTGKSSGGCSESTGRMGGNGIYSTSTGENKGASVGGFGDSGSAARFFYCAKASRSERDAGLEGFEAQRHSDRQNDGGVGGDNPRNRTNNAQRNFHPTVKPLALMRYLVRLVTPPGGTVLDPFAGSGTTLLAAKMEGFEYVGIEKEAEYAAIIEARLSSYSPEPVLF